ncbi:MAG: type II secretion system F family protein [Acidobacteriota bacterium]
MPEFICKLGTATGEVVQRLYSGESEARLRESLAEQDFLVLSIRRKLGFSIPFLGKHRRISQTEFLVFNQELAALIKAGLPILGSLDLLIDRQKHPVFKQSLVEIRDRVRSGDSLSEAFAAQGDLYPSLFATSLASGERSGEIATVLRRYINYMQSIAAVRKKIIAASVYPAILMAAMLVVIFVMVGVVFPMFSEFFTTMKADLPLPTRLLLGVSGWVSQNYALTSIILVSLLVAFFFWRKTASGARSVDRLKYRLPIAGPILHKFALTRFTRTLSTLLNGGIPMVTSLQIASRTVGSLLFSERLEAATRKVREGKSMGESLEETGLLSEMAVGMIRIGESSGTLNEMLDNVSEFHEAEIEKRIQTLLSLLEPVLLVVMAVVVGGLLLAVYMPLLSSFSSANI